MKNEEYYKAIFEQLKGLQKKYLIISCWDAEIIENEYNEFRFKNLTLDCFMQNGRYFDEVLVLDALTSLENDPLNVDKEGHYTFDALLSYSEEQRGGDYNQIEIPAYLYIDYIKFDYLCSFEEMKEMQEGQSSDEEINF
jgi:hypothetical protein